jgi:hypothetical protein
VSRLKLYFSFLQLKNEAATAQQLRDEIEQLRVCIFTRNDKTYFVAVDNKNAPQKMPN